MGAKTLDLKGDACYGSQGSEYVNPKMSRVQKP